MGKKNVFFSYCTADDEFVDQVFNIIQKSEVNSNLFKFNKHKYISNQSWEEIDKAIGEANIYFVFISKISLQSKSVLTELYGALNKSINCKNDNFKLIPIVIDDYSNWENDSPFANQPILNSLTRIEEFSRNPKNLSKYIIENIEKDQWPGYVPNIKFYGILINTQLPKDVERNINTQILIFKSNITIDKVSLLFDTKNNHIKNEGNSIFGNEIVQFKKPISLSNNITYNHINIVSSSIEKSELFKLIFCEESFYPKDDSINDIYVKYSNTIFYKINLTKISINKDELNTEKTDIKIKNILQNFPI